VTRSFHSGRSHPAAGLFRPADHTLVVPQGSAVTILDLERGVVYATTPVGAMAWSTLVGITKPPRRGVAEGRKESISSKGGDMLARIADYLLDQRLIEPVVRTAGSYLGTSPIR
jgi:hypothetical protein